MGREVIWFPVGKKGWELQGFLRRKQPLQTKTLKSSMSDTPLVV